MKCDKKIRLKSSFLYICLLNTAQMYSFKLSERTIIIKRLKYEQKITIFAITNLLRIKSK